MDKRETRRGRNYEIKSRNCKVDYAYVILSVDDDDNVKYFSEKGFTATMRHERYTQCINWDQDNRCKPDRGVFLCKIPDHGKICSLANHKLINGELSHTFYYRAYGFSIMSVLGYFPSQRVWKDQISRQKIIFLSLYIYLINN